MSLAATGAVVGLMGGIGAATAVAYSPPLRRPRLEDRLAPYLRDAPRPSRLLQEAGTVTPFPTLERLLGPTLHDLADTVGRVLGGTAALRRRLDAAGGTQSVEEFRVEQVVYGGAGLLAGLLLAGVAAVRGGQRSPLAFLILSLVLALAGVVLRDRLLTVAIQRREQRILAEFPTVAELLALSIGAGEGAVGALERVTRLATGELSAELARALADARSGVPLVTALEQMAARTPVAALARFVDGMAVAVERGTPLADVVRAQAADVREQGRRELLEAGGRKEIQMLVPVVFLVLPVTVVFALFPGFYALHLAVP